MGTDTPTDEILRLLTRDGGVIVRTLPTNGRMNRFTAESEPPMQALRPGSAQVDYADLGDCLGL
ncbi:hypothetical protein ACIRNU_12165 [Streptomyces rochei]|uniref:hypothetical protein n=1 Tax=Streptomyces rochei TaxID=1928 RepID=UPI0038262007